MDTDAPIKRGDSAADDRGANPIIRALAARASVRATSAVTNNSAGADNVARANTAVNRSAGAGADERARTNSDVNLPSLNDSVSGAKNEKERPTQTKIIGAIGASAGEKGLSPV